MDINTNTRIRSLSEISSLGSRKSANSFSSDETETETY